MRDSLLVRSLVFAGATAVVSLACGSEPKPEPNVAPSSVGSAAAPADAAAPPTPTAPDAGAPAKPSAEAECDELQDDANQTLDAELIAIDKPCKKDGDCMIVKGRACAFNCGNRAIPKVEEKDWKEAMSKVEQGACKKWNEKECSKLRTKPPPTCVDKKPWCDKGHCALK